MKLAEVLFEKGTRVHMAHESDPVLSAVETLVSHNIGALAILDTSDRLVGIFSERDILRLISRNAGELVKLKVGEFMTRDVITGKPDDTVDEAMATMTSHRIRHLPVVNHSGLVGMISIGDLVKARLDETEYHKQQMENLVLGRYPA
ncbi:MAG: CBS domain-containing protein [bacterium]|nr:CBS domain-containing protein [bacterium]MBK8127806.1 CBS domain-containing protein [bacterium]